MAVVDRIRGIASDPELARETVNAVHGQLKDQTDQVLVQLKLARGTLKRLQDERQDLLEALHQGGDIATRGAERLDQIAVESADADSEMAAYQDRLTELQTLAIDDKEIVQAISQFDPIWDVLLPQERARIIRLLIQQVDMDGENGVLGITFSPTGIKTLLSLRAISARGRNEPDASPRIHP